MNKALIGLGLAFGVIITVSITLAIMAIAPYIAVFLVIGVGIWLAVANEEPSNTLD